MFENFDLGALGTAAGSAAVAVAIHRTINYRARRRLRVNPPILMEGRPGVLREIADAARAGGEYEVLGWLIGRREGNRGWWVTSFRQCENVSPDPETSAREAPEDFYVLDLQPGEVVIGEWHSHPGMNTAAKQSEKDKRVHSDRADSGGFGRLGGGWWQLIVAHDVGEMAAFWWCGSARLFHRQDIDLLSFSLS